MTNTNNVEVTPVAGKDLGAMPAGFTGTEPPVRENEKVHAYMCGKDFAVGQTLTGKLLRTRRVFSDTFTNPKHDNLGRPYRDIHEFDGVAGSPKFNIWGSVGMLDVRLAEVPLGSTVAVTYLGRHQVEGVQGIPHTFKFILETGKTWAKRTNPVEINEAEGNKYLAPGARAAASAGTNANA